MVTARGRSAAEFATWRNRHTCSLKSSQPPFVIIIRSYQCDCCRFLYNSSSNSKTVKRRYIILLGTDTLYYLYRFIPKSSSSSSSSSHPPPKRRQFTERCVVRSDMKGSYTYAVELFEVCVPTTRYYVRSNAVPPSSKSLSYWFYCLYLGVVRISRAVPIEASIIYMSYGLLCSNNILTLFRNNTIKFYFKIIFLFN